MVKEGQEFKNYKEMCKYLGEEVKTGKSRELQLKRWQLSFSWHKEGYKIIVDKVERDYIEKACGGNRKHVKAFLPYVIYCLYKSGIKDEFVGTQRMVKSELKLVPSEVYRVYNSSASRYKEYLYQRGVKYESLRMFVHYFEMYVKETLEGCLNVLEKGGGLKWEKAQLFIVGVSHKKRVYVTGYDEVLDKVETSVCNKMNKDRDDLKGRQYLHVIKRDKKLTEKFYKECTKRLGRDKKLMAAVKEKYENEYHQEFDATLLSTYYRLYYISEINRQRLRKWALGKTDSIRIKKALVNADGIEVKMLKERVYKDVFERMIRKDRRNRFGILNEDFEKMKMIIKENKKREENTATEEDTEQIETNVLLEL